MAWLLHQLLERSADERPHATALVDGPEALTYAELEERANRLAHLFAELGVRRGDRVGLWLDKSADAVAAVYGAMKAGAAYVPFDPDAPVGRVAYAAGDCGVRVLVTATAKADGWPEVVSGSGAIEVLCVLDGDDPPSVPGVDLRTRRDLLSLSDDRPPPAAIDEDLAYILYTSGSTGRPKGVMLSHRNALAFVDWAARRFAVGAEDRLSSHAPLHFDLSVFDLYAAAHGGAAVVLVPGGTSVFPAQVARFIEDRSITVWYSVPSVLTMLALRGALTPGRLPGLRTVLFAGEVFPTKHLRRLMELLPHARFCNLYGPTETNVCTFYEVPPLDPERTEPIPIGRPIDNVETFVVREDGRPAAPGETGELWVRGATVMQGYWGDTERTEAVLTTDPTGVRPGPCYRTGDLVEEMPDGNYRFLGRRDAQIKSRGYRIELGDIEAALHAHPAVVECAVTAVPDELVTNRIRAHVVVREPVEAAELSRFCAERIPRYMIPELFAFPDRLPKTSTGKVDRQALATDDQ